MYLQFGKRIFDCTAALSGLILLALPMVIIALLIWIISGLPILFKQERVGRNGKIFYVKKFRTMISQNIEYSSITVANDKRITSIGCYLRRWKLDELPQLWNVFVGEMSLVGPRPDVPGYLDKLQGSDCRLLLLRPGITGPATLAYKNEEEILAKVRDPIEYNNKVIYPDKVRINLSYLENCSFSQDLRYISQTLFGIPSEVQSHSQCQEQNYPSNNF
jgi:lipopolysaccharide/colanic/teichoic acid biosynthesis glycosyltransferase